MEHVESARENRIRVLVADDSRIHTQLLADALRHDGGLQVSSSESESETLITLVKTSNINVDVLVVSHILDEQPCRGFDVLRELRGVRPEIRAVMLLDSSKDEVVLDAFRAGAKGVFSKHESVETLSKCIRSVYRGQIWANSQQMALAVEALASSPKIRAVDANGLSLLSKREMEVVRGLAEGLTNRAIAERLGLSQHTIRNHLFRLFEKLGVSSRIELLFMTLSHDSHSPSASRHFGKNSTTGSLDDDAALAEYQRAAEQGIPAAQMALAQLLSRKDSPKDLVDAYMWNLIASEQALRTSQRLNKLMTKEQLLEAERKAVGWIRGIRKIPPSSVEEQPSSPPLPQSDPSAA